MSCIKASSIDQVKGKLRQHNTNALNRPPPPLPINDADDVITVSPDFDPSRVIGPTTIAEGRAALSTSKLSSSSGPDGIPVTALRIEDDILYTINQSSKMFGSEYNIPSQWMHSIIVSIPKNGSSLSLDNQRGIAKSCAMSKFLNKIFFFIFQSLYSLYRTVRNIANIDRPSFIAELSSVSEFSSVENANQFSDFLRTVLDKHAPPSLRKVITHSSSPWFESIRDELFIAKRERRQAERKWRNTKLNIFKELYGQAKHKVSKLVHTAKCKFYTERIALASFSKELHQIVNTLSNRHPPKILPTIYPSADLPSIFIKHLTNKVQKLRANTASEHVTSTFVTGTTAANFSSFEKVSQLTVKECILNSAPKSCELDPIPFKLLIECLDSILPSLTDLFNSSLASGIFPQCFKSALVTPFIKKRCLDHNDLNNYRPVSNLCFIAKILEKLVLSQVSSYLNSHNLYNTCQSAYRPGHST